MRKRRRIADKLTISVCAVLVAVSAFFYAPMDAYAEEYTDMVITPQLIGEDSFESEDFDISLTSTYAYFGRLRSTLNTSFDFAPYLLNGDGLYEVTFDILFNFSCDASASPFWHNTYGVFDVSGSSYQVSRLSSGDYMSNLSLSGASRKVYIDSDNSIMTFAVSSNLLWRVNPGSCLVSSNVAISNISAVKLTSEDSSDYQDGYNAGYSDGESAGYGNGYTNGFADGEASVDTDAIYDEAFQAGKDSVDTQSYYDAGYQAGYQVAYSEGYESGYDEGYQSAMDRIDGWGADTSQYPVLVFDKSVNDITIQAEVNTNMPQVAYGEEFLAQLDFDVNPHHTYKIVFNSSNRSGSWYDFSGSQDEQLNYNIGSYSFPWYFGESFAFIEGSKLSSNIFLECYIYASHFYDTDGVWDNAEFQPWGGAAYVYLDYLDISVYDYGPSGDTQNHIANQTDQLTGGYNDSQGNSVNNDFSSGLNNFETAEDSLFATATTGLKDFTFFDFQSVPAMITGMSFVGSIMSGWFTQAGGASGVGIVLSILFSIMLVAMVLGLYRWYQSKGGKD